MTGGTDYDSMNCGQLRYLAQKYSSIADGALRMATALGVPCAERFAVAGLRFSVT